MRSYQKRVTPNLRRKSAWEPVALETEKPLIIYPRQSTPKQKKDNIYSREMQTTDLVAYARELGWSGDVKTIATEEDLGALIESVAEWRESRCIIVLEMDLGVSGKLKIERRKGMSCLVYLIGEGVAKTVMCQKEDRLFRDDTELEYNTYIQVCLRYEVKTVTEEFCYDFSILEHRKRFREKCDQAADFLEDYIRDRLQKGKLKASGEGKYSGGGFPPGFVPDRQKYLPNGDKNPNFGKIKPYDPWLPTYRWCFIRYRELGGNLSRLRKEIASMPVLFPDFEEGVLTEEELKLLHFTKVPGGYTVGTWGLKSILTHVAAIGWYRDKYGLLVDENGVPTKNHPPIFQEHEQDVFWYAFDRVSPVALDGTRTRPIPARFTRTPEESPALLKDIISSAESGKDVCVHKTSEGIMYSTYIHVPLLCRIETMVDHREVDRVFVRQLFTHLRRTRDFEHYRDYVKKEVQSHDQKKTHIDVQLQGIADQIAGIEATLELPPQKLSQQRREKYAENLALLEARKAELEKEKKLPPSLVKAQELMEYGELIDEIIEVWDEQTITYKKSFIETFVGKVELAMHAPHWYTLTCYWRDPTWGVEEAIIWKQSGIGKKWTEEELSILREKYSTSTTEEMLKALPVRTWTTIRRTAHIHNVKRQIKDNEPRSLSLAFIDLQFMESRDISYVNISIYKDGVWSGCS